MNLALSAQARQQLVRDPEAVRARIELQGQAAGELTGLFGISAKQTNTGKEYASAMPRTLSPFFTVHFDDVEYLDKKSILIIDKKRYEIMAIHKHIELYIADIQLKGQR